MPMQNSCTPAKNRMMHTRDGHPKALPPDTSWRTMTNRMAKKDAAHKISPSTDAMASGAVEKAMMPSRA